MGPQLLHALNYVSAGNLQIIYWNFMELSDFRSAILALSKEDYVHLREWFSEKDWEQWDKEIEGDSASGKLDFLMEEAVAEKNRGRLSKL